MKCCTLGSSYIYMFSDACLIKKGTERRSFDEN
jgi:hypothetical protein